MRMLCDTSEGKGIESSGRLSYVTAAQGISLESHRGGNLNNFLICENRF